MGRGSCQACQMQLSLGARRGEREEGGAPMGLMRLSCSHFGSSRISPHFKFDFRHLQL